MSKANLSAIPCWSATSAAATCRNPKRANDADTVSALSSSTSQEDKLRTLDTDLENVYTHEARADASSRESQAPAESGWASLRPTGGISLDSDEYDFSASLTKTQTLAEHLTDQLNLNISAPTDRIIGQNLIGMVNEAGYLTGDIADIANTLGTSARSCGARSRNTQDL